MKDENFDISSLANLEERIKSAMEIISDYGFIDGAHHKQWVIDQVARYLLADKYKDWADSQWDVGIPP